MNDHENASLESKSENFDDHENASLPSLKDKIKSPKNLFSGHLNINPN